MQALPSGAAAQWGRGQTSQDLFLLAAAAACLLVTADPRREVQEQPGDHAGRQPYQDCSSCLFPGPFPRFPGTQCPV